MILEKQIGSWWRHFTYFERSPFSTRNGCPKLVISSFLTMLQRHFRLSPHSAMRLPQQRRQTWLSATTPFALLLFYKYVICRKSSSRSFRLLLPNHTTNSSPILSFPRSTDIHVRQCDMFLSLRLSCLLSPLLQTQSSAATQLPSYCQDNNSWKP